MGRKVGLKEQSIKKVLHFYSINKPNSTQFTSPYGFWQTEPYKAVIQEDGKLPRNDYSNFKIFEKSIDFPTKTA